MTPEDLIEQLEDAGLTPRSYSGRGMYGRECVAAAVEFMSDVPKDLPTPSIDSLGKRFIAYWPSVKWPEGRN